MALFGDRVLRLRLYKKERQKPNYHFYRGSSYFFSSFTVFSACVSIIFIHFSIFPVFLTTEVGKMFDVYHFLPRMLVTFSIFTTYIIYVYIPNTCRCVADTWDCFTTF